MKEPTCHSKPQQISNRQVLHFPRQVVFCACQSRQSHSVIFINLFLCSLRCQPGTGLCCCAVLVTNIICQGLLSRFKMESLPQSLLALF